MKVIAKNVAVNLHSGARFERVVGDGESRLRRCIHLPHVLHLGHVRLGPKQETEEERKEKVRKIAERLTCMEEPMELNPNHPTTKTLHEHWHKVLAAVMVKLGISEVRLTEADVQRLASQPGGVNVVADGQPDGLIIRLVSDSQADTLAKKAGGLPT